MVLPLLLLSNLVVHTYASTRAHTPMKTSMKIFTVVVTMTIQLGSQFTPSVSAALARMRDSAMAPEAMAPPSDFTARPIQPPATIGSVYRKCEAMKGRISISMQVNTTTSEDTMIGTTGRERMAPPVAMAAETPQMEMPEASGAAHSRLNLKYFLAT